MDQKLAKTNGCMTVCLCEAPAQQRNARRLKCHKQRWKSARDLQPDRRPEQNTHPPFCRRRV